MIVGVAILFFGRKLFWLFVAALGLRLVLRSRLIYARATGLDDASYRAGARPSGALLAILLQKLAIAVAGFIAGGRLASALLAAFFVDYSHIAESLSSSADPGALLLLALFDWALIFFRPRKART